MEYLQSYMIDFYADENGNKDCFIIPCKSTMGKHANERDIIAGKVYKITNAEELHDKLNNLIGEQE